MMVVTMMVNDYGDPCRDHDDDHHHGVKELLATIPSRYANVMLVLVVKRSKDNAYYFEGNRDVKYVYSFPVGRYHHVQKIAGSHSWSRNARS